MLTIEWGTAVLDRGGNVLLRMRNLRGARNVRRIADACGLTFIEEQITDPAKLGQAPALVVGSLLGPRADRVMNAITAALSLGTGVAVITALSGGSLADSTFGAFFAGMVVAVITRLPFQWLVGWIADMIVR